MSRSKTKEKPKPQRDNIYAVPAFTPLYGSNNAVMAPRVVEDPYDGKPLTAIANIRDDPLGRYYARGQIDFSQWSAAVIWLRWWEIATLGGLKGYELRDPVSGGGAFPEALSDSRKEAIHELGLARSELGKIGDGLLQEVLGKRRFINEIAVSNTSNGGSLQREIDYLSRTFRNNLNVLSEYYGTITRKWGNNYRRQVNGFSHDIPSVCSVSPSS